MLSSYDYDNSYATEPDSRYIPGQIMLAFPLTTLAVSMPHVLQCGMESNAFSRSAAVPAVRVTLKVTMEEEREIVANSELSGS